MDGISQDPAPDRDGRSKPNVDEVSEDSTTAAALAAGTTSPDTVLVAGHAGASEIAGKKRLYSNTSMTEFIDIDERDIVESEQVSTGEAADVTTKLRLDANARVNHYRAQQQQARFLRGEFVSEPGTSRASLLSMGGNGIIQATTQPCIVIINRTFTVCTNTLFGICSSFGGICTAPPRTPSSRSPSGCLSLNACP